ncbi:hypothetical protein SNEBB_008292 [Seison nebaliae]|nr:hypothetical protein SNEBB_008292 [Seison nebaliae]
MDIPTWKIHIRRIQAGISKIENNRSAIEQSANEPSSNWKDVEELIKMTQALYRETQRLLDVIARDQPLNMLREEEDARKQEYHHLRNEFTKNIQRFKETEQQLAEINRQKIQKLKEQNPQNMNDLIDTSTDIEGQSSQTVMQMREKKANLEEIQQREKAIHDLEADIIDVNQIFKDVSIMVHDQGDKLDSIEGTVQNTQNSVRGANDELKWAMESQKKARKKKIYLFSILAIVVIIIIIIIVVKVKK